MQEKESIMVVWCELKIPSLGITVRHHSASLMMTEFSIRTSHPWKILIFLTLLCKVDSCNLVIWATAWENLFMPYANNKDADQPAHPRSLISYFVVHCLDSISLISISEISSLQLVSAVSSPTWLQTSEGRFSRDMAHLKVSMVFIIDTEIPKFKANSTCKNTDQIPCLL